jgi:hypothetical protein
VWTQTLLSMSDKMLALQEEEEKFLQMQQQQDAVLCSTESLSDTSAPQSPADLNRDSDLSRRSHEVARKLDRVVDTCNASFRGMPPILKSKTLSPILSDSCDPLPEVNQDEDQTLQMVNCPSCSLLTSCLSVCLSGVVDELSPNLRL